MTDYTTLDALKADLGIDNNDDNAALADAIGTASRAIDLTTETTFGADTAAARLYAPKGDGSVWVDRFTSTTDLVINGWSGTAYDQLADPADYVLWPYNAPSKGLAYRRVISPGLRFPYDSTGRPTVEVTAIWGWHYIPDDIERAARLKAARLFRRKDSPEELSGALGDSFGRISRTEDSDVWLLLRPYMPTWIR